MPLRRSPRAVGEGPSADAKKKKKPAPKPDPNPSAAAKPASSSASANSQATQAQSPLTPLWSVINENYTNGGVGPLHKTQNILIVEPIIPLKLTPDWNLITRWNTPITYMPRLAEPVGPFPGIGPEFGLSNMQPQFFFTPAHPGSFTFAVGPALWLPTATDKTLGINKCGWRAGRRSADDPGTFARRFPCPKRLGRHDRHERDRTARQHADH